MTPLFFQYRFDFISSSGWLGLAFLAVACNNGGQRSSPASSTYQEIPYCSEVRSYSNSIRVQGKALYQYRTDGNGPVASEPKPIRRAEVRVMDGNGRVIQCGETDGSGNFSLELPRSGEKATLWVGSRANNEYLKVYILYKPTHKAFYGVRRDMVLDRNQDLGELIASAATEDHVVGGAFNIMDKMLDTNNFLRGHTERCNERFTHCPPFTNNQLFETFWAPGVSPSDYDKNLLPSSFWIWSKKQLYILGGSKGDVDRSDTDHFDSTIIIHEYAHVLEDQFSIRDSVGGAHFGDNILDPRLAWSEAWANYLQAAVTGIPRYLDTIGNPEGEAVIHTNEDLQNGSPIDPDDPDDQTIKDFATELGEGNFREFSITRALWKMAPTRRSTTTDQKPESFTLRNPEAKEKFSELWTLFAAREGGFADPSQNFRSLGLFYVLQAGLGPNRSDWTQIREDENQLNARTHYANRLVDREDGERCEVRIRAEHVPRAQAFDQAPGGAYENGSFSQSNQFKSNDFYHVDHPGGNLHIVMEYNSTDPSDPANLDLYLYQNRYFYIHNRHAPGNILGSSTNLVSQGASFVQEEINLTQLPPGHYMLNVHYKTKFSSPLNRQSAIDSEAHYELQINSRHKCPASP